MKDSYSFDVADAGLEAAYHAHREAYQRIFDRLGSATSSSSTVSGAMGGSASEEFLRRKPDGEDTFVRCLDRVTPPMSRPSSRRRAPESVPLDGLPEAVLLRHRTTRPLSPRWWTGPTTSLTCGTPVTAADTLKNVLLKMPSARRRWELLVVGLPGDREVDEKRLGAALEPAEYALLDDADFAKYPFLVKGYIGPKACRTNGFRYLVDPRVVDGTAWITGADEPGRHVVGLVAGRDFTPTAPSRPPRCATATQPRRGRPAGLGARYRDRPHLPARPEIHRRVQRRRPRRGRQTGAVDHGLLRHRRVAAGRRHRRAALRRAGPALAVGVAPFDVHLVIANKDARGSTRGRAAGRRPRRPGVDVLLDDRKGLARGQVQGRRTARSAVDRRGGPRLGRRRRRTARPVYRGDPCAARRAARPPISPVAGARTRCRQGTPG